MFTVHIFRDRSLQLSRVVSKGDKVYYANAQPFVSLFGPAENPHIGHQGIESIKRRATLSNSNEFEYDEEANSNNDSNNASSSRARNAAVSNTRETRSAKRRKIDTNRNFDIHVMMHKQPITPRGERKVLLRVEGTIFNKINDMFENRGGVKLKLSMRDFLRPYMQSLDARKNCSCRPFPMAYMIDISYLLTISTPQLRIVKSMGDDVAYIEAEVVIPDIARMAWVDRGEVVQGKFSLEMCPADPAKLGPNHLLVNENILKNEVASDFTIVASNGAEIKCHKSFILGHNIPAFRAMLENDYEESRNNKIKMDDLSEAGVRAFMKYLYVGDVSGANENPEIAFELLYSAQKYGVENLKRSIVNLFRRQKDTWFTVELALKLFVMSRGMTDGNVLKKTAGRVLKKNLKRLQESEELKKIMREQPEMGIEIMQCMN